jgi:tetratricopeptide (TPR) repeat protein
MVSIGSRLHSQHQGPRLVPRLAMLVLLMVLVGVLRGLAQAPDRSAETAGLGDSAEARQAIESWETLWSNLAERGVAALSPETSDPSRRAAGDTVFMRYRNLWGQIDDEARLSFQLAALSGDPARKRALIEPLTLAEEPLIRFRAYLELARLQRRRQDFESARAAVRTALGVPDLSKRVRSDAWFILADIAWEQDRLDEAETALTTTIEDDPGFWDARRLRLEVLARRLGEPRQRGAVCLDRTRRMIEDLGALPALAEDQTQLRDLADRFARQGAPTHVALALIAGLGYRWSGDGERARITLESAEELRGRLPAGCERLILERVAGLLEPVLTPEPPP